MQSVEFDPETEEEFGVLNEAFTSIGSSPWMIAVVAVIVIAGVGFWIYYLRHGASRAPAIRAAALAAGCRYLSADPAISQVRMSLFGGEEPAIHNVVVKPDRLGTEARAFEYVQTRMVTKNVADDDGLGMAFGEQLARRTKKVRQHSGGRRTAGVAKVPAYLPRMVISGEKTSRKLLDVVGAADLELESDEFNQMFDVRTTHRNFAHAFLDARMMDFMLQTDGGVEFETFGHWIMLCLDRVAPEEMPAVCNLVEAFRSNIPKLVIDDYPLPSVQEDLARPPAGFEPSHFGNVPKQTKITDR